MAKYVCRRRLKFGDGWLEPGMEFPVRPYLRYDYLLSMGWIERAIDGASVPAPAQVSSQLRSVLPANLSSLKKAELFDIADELNIGTIDGTGSGGLVTKADLMRAIKAHGDK